jgi:hypothetical protein
MSFEKLAGDPAVEHDAGPAVERDAVPPALIPITTSKPDEPDEPDEPGQPDAEDEAFRQAQENLRKAPGDLEVRAQFRQALKLRRQKRALCRRAESETVPWRRYRRLRELGYTPGGARWEIEQDAAEATVATTPAATTPAATAAPTATSEAAEAHAAAETVKAQPPQLPVWGTVEFPPYTALKVVDQHTAFEWVMLAAGLDPNAPWVGIQGDAMSDAEARETRMLTLVPELWLNLKQDIEGNEMKPVRRGYYRTIGGFRRQDLTTSTFDAETMAAFFTRVGGYGAKISAWLSQHAPKSEIAGISDEERERSTSAAPLPRQVEAQSILKEALPPQEAERIARLDRWWADQRWDANTFPNRDKLLASLKEKFSNPTQNDARTLRRHVPDKKRHGGRPWPLK